RRRRFETLVRMIVKDRETSTFAKLVAKMTSEYARAFPNDKSGLIERLGAAMTKFAHRRNEYTHGAWTVVDGKSMLLYARAFKVGPRRTKRAFVGKKHVKRSKILMLRKKIRTFCNSFDQLRRSWGTA